jgi:hypothetical protein
MRAKRAKALRTKDSPHPGRRAGRRAHIGSHGWLSDRLLDIFGRDDLEVPLTELAELIALGRSSRDSYGP